MKRTFLSFALCLAMAVPSAAQEATTTGDPERGAAVYNRCAGCHSVGEGAMNKLGPHLNGLIGRVAGSLSDYTYSQAMTEAGANGLVWSVETLRSFLENPKDVVPGTKMQFAGMSNEREFDDLFAYLASLSPASP